jgi:lysosomal Pro-X carboxypeptidase
MLDPWTAAGVTNNVSDSVVSVLLKYGGHHLDLFFPSENDPQCAIDARKLEKEHVVKWITDYNKKL